MEKESKISFERVESVISLLQDARTRLSNVKQTDQRDNPEVIWESYCDVEQSIELSKFVFNLNSCLGKIRALPASKKNAPESMPTAELMARCRMIDSFLVSATAQYQNGNGGSGIEFARRARDELKILLGNYRMRNHGQK